MAKSQGPKNSSKPKKQKPPELRTWANQGYFLPPKLDKPLLNGSKYLLKLQY